MGFKIFEGEKKALSIESLSIQKGEAYGLVGESGAGKTVLAQTILRLLPCPPCIIGKESKINFDGENLLALDEKDMRRRIRGKKIAMIFQDPMSTLNPVFTVGEQLTGVFLRHRAAGRRAAAKGVAEMLERVRLPDAERLMKKYPHELSGGQRQRVIIAAALSCGAEFLIADEPTRNLDVTIQAGILEIISDLRRELGITVLFIANNMGLVSVCCDKVAVLKEGAAIESGPVREVIDRPKSDYTRLLLKSLPDKPVPADPGERKTLFIVKDLKKYFPVWKGHFRREAKQIKAVDGVSLEIRAGDTLGIVGESGCGKTTLINVLLNLDSPTAGEAEFEGLNLYRLSKSRMRSMRRHIQVVFQDPFWSLNPRMLIRDIIGEPLKVHARLSAGDYNRKAAELLELVGLPPEAAYRFPHEFSGGQRQRVAIARALALEARFIVLDEPTSSIDVVSQAQILALLEDLKRRYNLTYVIISHDLSVVHFMSTEIIVMYLGKIVESGPAEAVFVNPLHPYTQALMGAIPRLDMKGLEDLRIIEGGVPSAIDIPPGCRFHTRCPRAGERCRREEPALEDRGGRVRVACFEGV
ncbi:MAG: ABC transporter ATP-binding protein [Treponema sp.]|nr:ABC transporter ATP-binding protein [Treponema sp.]